MSGDAAPATHDDGVHWLYKQLRERFEPLRTDARERYLDATSGLEEEYFRGQRDAYDDVLEWAYALVLRPGQ